MGCDIHLQAERQDADGAWHRIPHPERPCERCDGTGIVPDDIPNEKMRGEQCWNCSGSGRTIEQFWRSRNYRTFSILAGVRNEDNYVPISAPRGLPADLSPELKGVWAGEGNFCDRCGGEYRLYATAIKRWVDQAGKSHSYEAQTCAQCLSFFDDFSWHHSQSFYPGDHSASWLTVQEILDYDWTQTTMSSGWVDLWQFQVYRLVGQPQTWSGGVSGGSIEHISRAHAAHLIDEGGIEWTDGLTNEEALKAYTSFIDRPYRNTQMAEIIELITGPEPLEPGTVGSNLLAKRYFTKVEWETPYTEAAADFLHVLNRDLIPLAPDGDCKRLRIVFDFDS